MTTHDKVYNFIKDFQETNKVSSPFLREIASSFSERVAKTTINRILDDLCESGRIEIYGKGRSRRIKWLS